MTRFTTIREAHNYFRSGSTTWQLRHDGRHAYSLMHYDATGRWEYVKSLTGRKEVLGWANEYLSKLQP